MSKPKRIIQGRSEIEVLRDAEARYRTLFQGIDEALCIIQMIFDQDGKPVDYRFLEANPSFEKQTGLVDVLGKSMRELAPLHEEYWFETYGKVALTGESVRIQKRAEQLQRWYDLFAFRIGAPENRHVAVLFNDITERKLADMKLRESEAKFSKAFQAAPALISISSLAAGDYLDVNEEFLRTLGYQRDEVVGHSSRELGIWETPGDRDRMIAMLRENRKVRNFGTHLRSKSGSLISGLISTEIIGIAGEECLLIITRDITELRKIEEERTRLSLIVESSDDAIIGKTLEGFITSWNRGAERIYGYSAREVTGRHISLLAPPEFPDEIPRILDKLRQGEAIERLETNRVRKDGRIIPVALTVSPIKDEAGRIVGASTIARDISERKQAEQEILRLNADLAARAAELESANRDLEGFNYTVAHDLRQPLNVINGYCQAIEMRCGDKLQQECAEFVRGAYDATLRMNGLIEALLNFSRLGRIEPKRAPVDLSGLAGVAAAELRLSEPVRRVDFRIAAGVQVEGDAELLRVVLDNLLGNAFKYTRSREEAVIEFGATLREGSQVCFVRDNGTGFDMAHGAQLFVPFQRLPGSEEFRGFGVGLATVERIIRRHGGSVWAEGEPGRGATFFFTLGAGQDQPGVPDGGAIQ
jgi:PAS domain S-box-containing protein